MGLLYYAYKQKNDWACGPATARTILHHYGVATDISDTAKLLKTTRGGTKHKDLAGLFRKKGLKFLIKKGAQTKDIKKYLKNYWAIVAYWIPSQKAYHYSIVKNINSKRIYFHDTWFGSSHSYTINYFYKNWYDDEATRWLMAVKK